MRRWNPALPSRLAAPLLALIAACGAGEPTTSYCEAVCDWAVTCAASERTVDTATLEADCLAATRASDDGCAKAEDGTLDPLTREATDACTLAIATESATCDAFVGTIDQLKAATPPAECASAGADAQATFQAAQAAVTETGDQLCQRFTETFCGRLDECLISDLGEIPQPVVDELGTPFELCVERLAFQTTSCQTQALYLEEADLTDVNPTRQAARECLRGVGATECDPLLAGEVPEECAGAFASAEDTLAFGTAMFEVAQDVATAVQEFNGTTP